MARSHKPALGQLPEIDDVWLIVTRQLRIWIAPEGRKRYQPHALLIISSATGFVHASEIFESPPASRDLRDLLFEAMQTPTPTMPKPSRPHGIALADTEQLKELADLLRAEKIPMEFYTGPLPPEVDEILDSLEAHMDGGGGDPLRGMLATPAVTPHLVGDFFAAAADFYRAAPWVRLNNYQVVALRHPREQDFRYVIVMGQGGVEYGLATLPSWAEVEYFFTSGASPQEKFARGKYHSLFFDEIDLLPQDDVDAIETYHWTVAAPNAYPVALVVNQGGTSERPSALDLEWYIGALRVLPLLTREYLKADAQGDYLPIETTLQVPLGDGMIAMDVKYPAGTLPRHEMAVQEEWDDEIEADDALPALDRRAMEGMMAQLGAELGAESDVRDPQLRRAQELMYQAFDTDNPAKRIALAHDALALSENCADAWVLLAEEEADTVARAAEYYQKGIAAGERALGKSFFLENKGHFWGILETRPYMRAKMGLADTLWQMNRLPEAMQIYLEMLELNPNDNQGVRELLMILYLQLERWDELGALLEKYAKDAMAVHLYTTALHLFHSEGPSARSNKALRAALKENPFVPPYLLAEKRLPSHPPDYIGFGDDREAQSYASQHLNYWRREPGASEWLRTEFTASKKHTRVERKAARSGQPKGKAKGKRKSAK